MKVSTLLSAATFLAAVRAQDTTTTDTTATDTTSTTTTDDLTGPTVTLPPDVCPTAGLESCTNILSLLEPTVYVILTVESSVPASLSAEETITSGDPILTQTENLATGSDDAVVPPQTAVVRISYIESDRTTCDEQTVTSTLTDPAGGSECALFTAPFQTPPPATTKTRIFIKGRNDEEVGKDDGDNGGGNNNNNGGGDTSPTPGGNTDLPVNTGTTEPGADATTDAAPTDVAPTDVAPIPGSTEGSSPSATGTIPTETYPAGSATDSATYPSTSDSASEEPPSSDSTTSYPDSNYTPTTMDSPTTLMTAPSSSSGASEDESSSSGGVNQTGEQGKGELTSYTTIAEVTDGVTNYVTKPIATLTNSGTSVTSTPGVLTGAGSIHTMIKEQVLLGAVGLAVYLGL